MFIMVASQDSNICAIEPTKLHFLTMDRPANHTRRKLGWKNIDWSNKATPQPGTESGRAEEQGSPALKDSTG